MTQHKNRGRRIIRTALTLTVLALAAVGLGFLLGLARPRHDVGGGPGGERRRS